MPKHNKEEFNSLLKLHFRQAWISSKKDELDELINFCDSKKNKNLIFSLLERFEYLDTHKLNYIYDKLSDYIINESEFCEDTTQFLSMTMDEKADSSQKILDQIKHYFFKKGWRNITTVNNFNKYIRHYQNGKVQILLIDEFIGSGRTLLGRIDRIKREIKGDYELKCIFIAGIKDVVQKLSENGIDIFCALELEKGISGHYKDQELIDATNCMLDLENKLAKKINTKELSDYSFGYGKAEALYSMEGSLGNTPNSVFPIFWWLEDINGNKRNTLLIRYETGF